MLAATGCRQGDAALSKPAGFRYTLRDRRKFSTPKPLPSIDIGRGDTFGRDTFIAFYARVGIGHDTHRLEPGGPLVLGGLRIDHDRHSVGHSDADVLLHAVTDAILGAAALGDIGELFPDTDPVNKGRDSADMLRIAWHLVHEAGWKIANLDCIVFAERPKITPHKEAIRQRLSELLRTETKRINIKAKTGERVGPVGREEAIVAECIVQLVHGPSFPY